MKGSGLKKMIIVRTVIIQKDEVCVGNIITEKWCLDHGKENT